MEMGDSAAGLRRTGLGTGGEDDGQVEDLAELRVSHDVVLHLNGRLITGDLVETFLEVDDEQGGVVLVDPLILECRSCQS